MYLGIKKYDYLFLANKRIAELEKWGSEMTATGEHIASWQTNLEIYKEAIEEQLLSVISPLPNAVKKNEELIKLNKHLEAHRTKLYVSIYNLSRSDAEKSKLRSLVDKIFGSIHEKLNDHLRTYPTNQIVYSLSEMSDDREFGIYDLYINSDQTDSESLPSLVITNDIITQILPKRNESDKAPSHLDLEPYFQDIRIVKSMNQLILEVPQVNNIVKKNQFNQVKTRENKPYKYSLDMPQTSSKKYAILFSYEFDHPVTLQLESFYQNDAQHGNENDARTPALSDILMEELLISNIEARTIRTSVQIPSNREFLYHRFLLISDHPISTSTLRRLQMEVYPLYEPELILLKKSSLPNAIASSTIHKIKDSQFTVTNTNTTIEQDAYILDSLGLGWSVVDKKNTGNISQFSVVFWPIQLFFVLWLLSLAPITLHVSHRLYPDETSRFLYVTTRFTFKTLIEPIHLVWRLVKSLCIKFKLLVLVITVVGILYDIFLYKSSDNLIIAFFALLWSGALIGYRAKSRISFIFAVAFLVVTSLLLEIKMDLIAEKIATWAYIFLVVGAIHSIIGELDSVVDDSMMR